MTVWFPHSTAIVEMDNYEKTLEVTWLIMLFMGRSSSMILD